MGLNSHLSYFPPKLMGDRASARGRSKSRLASPPCKFYVAAPWNTSETHIILLLFIYWSRGRRFISWRQALIQEDFALPRNKCCTHLHCWLSPRPMSTYCSAGKCLLIGQKVRTLADKLSPCHCHNLRALSGFVFATRAICTLVIIIRVGCICIVL